MQAIINILGTLTVGLCAFLLLRAYANVRKRLLLWSGLCFAGLMVSNAITLIDLWVIPETVNLYRWRLGVAALSMMILLYGLVFESD